MTYNKIQQNKIQNIFTSFNSEEIMWVVPRGHKELPERTAGGDIDVIVHSSDFDRAVNTAKKEGFHPEKVKPLVNLGQEAVMNPASAISMLFNSPKRIPELMSNHMNGDLRTRGSSSVSDWRGYNEGVMIHLRDHLAFKSPWRKGKYRISSKVEQQMFEYKIKDNNIYVSSPPDELVNLISRGTFHKSEFPDYYVQRCNELLDKMDNGECDRFRELLQLVFLEAHEVVYDNVVSNQYNSIRQDLLAYSDY